jgi:hypothetical protein
VWIFRFSTVDFSPGLASNKQQTKQTNMIFRPLALAAAVAGSIGLSSAEINYSYKEGDIVSAGTAGPDGPTAAFQLASKSKFCASIL